MNGHKRIFDSNESPEWLAMHKPYGSTLRRTKQDDAWVIEGSVHDGRTIDQYVDKMASDTE